MCEMAWCFLPCRVSEGTRRNLKTALMSTFIVLRSNSQKNFWLVKSNDMNILYAGYAIKKKQISFFHNSSQQQPTFLFHAKTQKSKVAKLSWRLDYFAPLREILLP